METDEGLSPGGISHCRLLSLLELRMIQGLHLQVYPREIRLEKCLKICRRHLFLNRAYNGRYQCAPPCPPRFAGAFLDACLALVVALARSSPLCLNERPKHSTRCIAGAYIALVIAGTETVFP